MDNGEIFGLVAAIASLITIYLIVHHHRIQKNDRHRREGPGFNDSRIIVKKAKRISEGVYDFNCHKCGDKTMSDGKVPQNTPFGQTILLVLRINGYRFRSVEFEFEKKHEYKVEYGENKILIENRELFIRYKYDPKKRDNKERFNISFINDETGFKATHTFEIKHGNKYIKLVKPKL